MMRIKRIGFFVLLLFSFQGMAQQPVKTGREVPAGFCISPLEAKLYKMINDYRLRYDLPVIPLSRSLCFVASTHVKDLYFNHPDVEPCNFHSWSNKGTWKPFCYPKDENKKNSVWDKPKELTNYKGKGYEIVYWENNAVMIDSIIAFWRSIPYFNSFLMNTGKWQGKKWNAIGIGIYENYACAWFGELPDAEPSPAVCGATAEQNAVADTLKSRQDKEKSKEKPVPAPVPASPGTKPSTAPGKQEISKQVPGLYYIIVKSQYPIADMNKSLADLKANGYPDARLIERDNKTRLSIMEFQLKAKADSALREVKKKFKDAWILSY
ncbi:MAG TPA: SPOR domain-containing protein [Bacteroidales bacterium]|nr:SPOR domain-containing protein [Bacteroidales bacterium]